MAQKVAVPFRCMVREVEDQTSAWITAVDYSEEVKTFFRAFCNYMQAHHHLCMTLLATIIPGLLTAVRDKYWWLRGEVTEIRAGAVAVFLWDCGKTVEREVSQVWILSSRFRSQPWQAIRMNLEGIRPRNSRPITQVITFAKHAMENRSGCVINISTTEDGQCVHLLGRFPDQPPHDVAQGWFQPKII